MSGAVNERLAFGILERILANTANAEVTVEIEKTPHK